MAKGMTNPSLQRLFMDEGPQRGSLEQGLNWLIAECNKVMSEASSVLLKAGINPSDVNSDHLIEAQTVKKCAQDLINIHEGTYTWNLAAKPKLVPQELDAPRPGK